MLIGELSRRSGVSARMLRHYDALGLVTPSGRTAGGYRDYSAADLLRLFQVESLRSLGLSLGEVRDALTDSAVTPEALIAELIGGAEQRIAREQELLGRLRLVSAAGAGDWAEVLRIVQLLRETQSEHPALRQRAALATPGSRLPADVLADALLAESDPNVAGALRWALAAADGEGLEILVAGLDATDGDVRLRALLAIAEIQTADAMSALEHAMASGDDRVRRHAALALGSRGRTAAVPTLLGMIEEGVSDIEAAETLGRLATTDDLANDLAAALVGRLAEGGIPAPARLRLVQALAEIPSAIARAALTELTNDEDRAVALTATAITRAADRATRSGSAQPAPPS